MNLEKQFKLLQKSHEKLKELNEYNVEKEFRYALNELHQMMSEMFRKYEVDGKLSSQEMRKYNRIGTLYAMTEEIVIDMYKKVNKNTKIILEEDYKLGYSGVKDIIETTKGKTLIPIVKDEVIDKALNNDISGLKWTEKMNLSRDYAVAKIRETTAAGLRQGVSYRQMADRLEDTLSKQVVNPVMIVRTESHRIFSESKKDSLDHASNKGVEMIKYWFTMADERVRGRKPKDKADHVSMNGKSVPYKDDFILPDGAKGFAPGQIGVSHHDIQCRCGWRIEIL